MQVLRCAQDDTRMGYGRCAQDDSDALRAHIYGRNFRFITLTIIGAAAHGVAL
jgi:hypothetical protein